MARVIQLLRMIARLLISAIFDAMSMYMLVKICSWLFRPFIGRTINTSFNTTVDRYASNFFSLGSTLRRRRSERRRRMQMPRLPLSPPSASSESPPSASSEPPPQSPRTEEAVVGLMNLQGSGPSSSRNPASTSGVDADSPRSSSEERVKSIARTPWSRHEDDQLMEGVQIHGANWELLSQIVQGRTPSACSTRYSKLMREKVKEQEADIPEENNESDEIVDPESLSFLRACKKFVDYRVKVSLNGEPLTSRNKRKRS